MSSLEDVPAEGGLIEEGIDRPIEEGPPQSPQDGPGETNMPNNAKFIHDGDSIDYTPGVAVQAGDVVIQGDLIGIAKRDIAANTLGAIAVKGVFDVPKATGAGTGIGVGITVYWATGTQTATATSSGNKLLGKVVRGSADADAFVRVRLFQ